MATSQDATQTLPRTTGRLGSPSVVFQILAAASVLAVFASYFYLSPGTDDAYYVLQGMAVVQHGTPAMHYGDVLLREFNGFPGYAVVTGLFYGLLDLFGIPLNVLTSRLWQMLAVIGCMAAAIATLRRVPGDDATAGFHRGAIFIVLLWLSTFPYDAMFLRPEPTGLLLLMASGLLLGHGEKRAVSGGRLGMWAWGCASGIAIGSAGTTHPSILVIGGITGVALLARQLVAGRFALAAAFSLGAAFPLGGSIAWFLSFAPTSVDIIMAHIDQRSGVPGSTVRGLVGYILEALRNPLTGTALWAIGFTTLNAVLIVGLGLGLHRYRIIKAFGAPDMPTFLVASLMTASIAFLLTSTGGRIQVYTPVSYIACLFAAFHLPVGRIWMARGLSHGAALAAGLLCISYFPAAHALKHYLLNEKPFHHLTAQQKVGPRLDQVGLFLSTPENFLLPFTARLARSYAETGHPGAYWLFPYTAFAPKRLELGGERIACLLEAAKGQPVLWAVWDPGTRHGPDGTTFTVNHGKNAAVAEFNVTETLYRFRDGGYYLGHVKSLRVFTDTGAGVREQQVFPRASDAPPCGPGSPSRPLSAP